MTEAQAQITIGMPIYNDMAFLAKSIDSVLHQSFTNFLLILSDDASTDGSDEICKAYALKDKRIKYIRHQTNLGISRHMKFLLEQAKTPYFMWFGDDDLMAKNFIETIYLSLKSKPHTISAFCTYQFIDENDNAISKPLDFDFSEEKKIKRLLKFIRHSDDIMGYGLFETKAIKNVEFPVWWWPNRNTPLNNIYPSICYYLSKGNYSHSYSQPLYFKRVKSDIKHNYITSVSNKGIKNTIAFVLRRFNLCAFSLKMIIRSSGLATGLIILPSLFKNWFITSIFREFRLIIKNKIN